MHDCRISPNINFYLIKDKWQGNPCVNVPSLCCISLAIFYFHSLFLCFSTHKSFLCFFFFSSQESGHHLYFFFTWHDTKRRLKDADVLYKLTAGTDWSWNAETKLTGRKKVKGRALTLWALQGSSGCCHHVFWQKTELVTIRTEAVCVCVCIPWEEMSTHTSMP